MSFNFKTRTQCLYKTHRFSRIQERIFQELQVYRKLIEVGLILFLRMKKYAINLLTSLQMIENISQWLNKNNLNSCMRKQDKIDQSLNYLDYESLSKNINLLIKILKINLYVYFI